jgi:hypothetical protein
MLPPVGVPPLAPDAPLLVSATPPDPPVPVIVEISDPANVELTPLLPLAVVVEELAPATPPPAPIVAVYVTELDRVRRLTAQPPAPPPRAHPVALFATAPPLPPPPITYTYAVVVVDGLHDVVLKK